MEMKPARARRSCAAAWFLDAAHEENQYPAHPTDHEYRAACRKDASSLSRRDPGRKPPLLTLALRYAGVLLCFAVEIYQLLRSMRNAVRSRLWMPLSEMRRSNVICPPPRSFP